jgi:hypothetical protein
MQSQEDFTLPTIKCYNIAVWGSGTSTSISVVNWDLENLNVHQTSGSDLNAHSITNKLVPSPYLLVAVVTHNLQQMPEDKERYSLT